MIHYVAAIDGPLVNRYNPSAMTNDEVRRRRLAQLSDEVGGLSAIAAKLSPPDAPAAKVSAKMQNLHFILVQQKASHKRADGTFATASMGSELAREIEKAYGLPRGWMDWPLPLIDFERFMGLNETQKTYFQAQLMAVLESAEKVKAPAVLQQIHEPAVASKKVAQAYKSPPKKAAKKKADERERQE